MQPFQHGAPVKIMNGIVYIVSFLRSLRSLRSACVSLNTQRVSVWGRRLQGLVAAWPMAPRGAARCGHHLGRGRFKKCQCPGARDVEWFDPGWSPETNYFLFPSQAFFRISLLGISVLKTEHRTQHLSSGNQSVWCESSSGARVLHVLVPLP